MPDLTGKSALITGASRGIGAAASLELARRGASVFMVARSDGDLARIADQIREDGGTVATHICDVSQYDDVLAAVAACQEQFVRLDILVNNAGVIDPILRLAESDPDKWDMAVDINLKGVYHGMRAALPVMLEQGSGLIINLSSGAAINVFEGWSHYCATKAAVLSLTKSAHKEYFEQGIRTVGLVPGMVTTGMQDTIRDAGIDSLGPIDPARYVSPEWVARAIAWLCTEDAQHISGEDFSLKTEENRRMAGLV